MRLAITLLGLVWALSLVRAQDAVSLSDDALSAYAAEPSATEATTPRTAFTDEERADIRRRLRDMDCIIDKRDHPIVESYLRGYILRNREKSERILGRVPTYFPMFERELKAAGMPDDIKYLAIVESALQPRALSHAGAGGLWQFMPATGQEFGMRIDRTVDERGDPLLATRAAIRYLRDEYKRFGDWSLVLAAYNGGPGRVRRALRRTGKRDFWSIHRYLPRETRNYVPAFVAAMYLHKYADLHGLEPLVPALDEQLVSTVPCPEGIDLREVAQATGLPFNTVRAMNPHCLQSYLPAGRQANCRVPTRAAAALRNYLSAKRDDPGSNYVSSIKARPLQLLAPAEEADAHYYTYDIEVPAGGISLSDVAADHEVSVHHLKLWNPGTGNYIEGARTLQVYSFHGELASSARDRQQRDIAPLRLSALTSLTTTAKHLPKSLYARTPNRQITVRRYETMLDIWQRFANTMTWQEFVSWNAIGGDTTVRVGDTVLVRS